MIGGKQGQIWIPHEKLNHLKKKSKFLAAF